MAGVTGGICGSIQSGFIAAGDGSLLALGTTSLIEMWARSVAANNLEIPQGYQIYMWGASWASWFAVAALQGGVPHVKAGGKLMLVGVAMHLIGWIR